MSTDFHIRVREILEAALDQRTTRRRAFIERAAGGRSAVLHEAQSLLPHYLKATKSTLERARRRLPGMAAIARLSRAYRDDVEWKPPFSIPPYRVVEVLGCGGMGVVYEGVQTIGNKHVAIKVLRQSMLSSAHQRRFAQEEELLRGLHHPGIVRFLEAGIARLARPGPAGSVIDRRPYFVMEYVRGGPLVRYADERGLDALARLELLAKICEAVDYAHHHGVIHRDLKPDNILVDRHGEPKILDFGIARLQHFGGRPVQEAPGFAGTPAYASPEQRAGQTRALTSASDVYTLGLIAHELLTGRLPRRAPGRLFLNLRNLHVAGSGPLSGKTDDEFRRAIHVILAAALRGTRGQPYTSAGALAADLTSVRQVFFHRVGKNATGPRLTALRRQSIGSPTTHERLLCALLRKRIGLAIEATEYHDTPSTEGDRG